MLSEEKIREMLEAWEQLLVDAHTGHSKHICEAVIKELKEVLGD